MTRRPYFISLGEIDEGDLLDLEGHQYLVIDHNPDDDLITIQTDEEIRAHGLAPIRKTILASRIEDGEIVSLSLALEVGGTRRVCSSTSVRREHEIWERLRMNREELIADMLNRSGRQEEALSRAVKRAREAKVNGGEPDAAWAMGEKLMTALVFQSEHQLEALGYSEADAIDRLRYDFAVSAEEFPSVLEEIRSEL